MNALKWLLIWAILGLVPVVAQDDESKSPAIRIVLPEANAVYGKYLPVQVEVDNFRLTNDWSIPGVQDRAPGLRSGHLHYVLDNRPLAHTTATQLILEDLPTAEHVLVISLMNHDHTPIGLEERIIFKVTEPRKGLSRPAVVGQTPP